MQSLFSFPRATRGWKRIASFAFGPSEVSPALRGDGRWTAALMRDRMAFPPRYAGMEGLPLSTALSAMCFPRATRGWKDKMIIFDSKGDVSPALRGDGSSAVVVHGFEHLFPPRYAGMEVPRSPIRRTPYGFPRATRGWKGSIGISGDAVNVSPALRGDGRASEAAKRSSLAFPPRYAGTEGDRLC